MEYTRTKQRRLRWELGDTVYRIQYEVTVDGYEDKEIGNIENDDSIVLRLAEYIRGGESMDVEFGEFFLINKLLQPYGPLHNMYDEEVITDKVYK